MYNFWKFCPTLFCIISRLFQNENVKQMQPFHIYFINTIEQIKISLFRNQTDDSTYLLQ